MLLYSKLLQPMILAVCWLICSLAAASNGQYENCDLKRASEAILNLGAGELIPQRIIDNCSSELVAKLIVQRLRNEEKRSSGELKFNEIRVQIQFDEKYIVSISSKGFLNQHQLGFSAASLAPESRAKLENKLSGLKLESTYKPGLTSNNSLRPKYAYVAGVGKSGQNNRYRNDYGNVVAEFEDSVLERTTFTAGDSLATAAMEADYDPRTSIWKYTLSESVSTAHTLSYARRDTLVIPESSSSGQSLEDCHYWEAQIWGELRIEKDVKQFLVGCPGLDATSAKGIEALKQTGKPVYRCALSKDGSRMIGTSRVF